MPPSTRSRPLPSIPLPPRPARPADPSGLSDDVLAARAGDGDRSAVEALLARHGERVSRLAHSILADAEDARDAAQETLARVVDRIGSYRGEASFTTWLHRLTVNVCIDVGRQITRRRRSEVSVPDDEALDPTDPARSLSDRAAGAVGPALRLSFTALSDAQRTVVVLKDVLSYSYDEIAERLELPVGTVKSHAHRGRRLLAERLRKTP